MGESMAQPVSKVLELLKRSPRCTRPLCDSPPPELRGRGRVAADDVEVSMRNTVGQKERVDVHDAAHVAERTRHPAYRPADGLGFDGGQVCQLPDVAPRIEHEVGRIVDVGRAADYDLLIFEEKAPWDLDLALVLAADEAVVDHPYVGGVPTECFVGPASKRSRTAGVPARSTTVSAMASAPSRTALSADSVTHAAVNSGWWLLAPLAAISIIGWMVGIRSDTLAMSVEPLFMGGRLGKMRPMASALRRYISPISRSGVNSE